MHIFVFMEREKMRCPKCNQWTLEFDEYFGRLRCFNPDCLWMPASSVEREIKKLKSHERPTIIDDKSLEHLGIQFKVQYDHENDILSFNFGFKEASYEMPEPDGIMIWEIGKVTGNVVGFLILDAKVHGISGVEIQIASRAAKKDEIEKWVRKHPSAFASGNITKLLIESVEVTTHAGSGDEQLDTEIKSAVEGALSKFDDYIKANGFNEVEKVST